MIFEVIQDFHDAVAGMPTDHPKHRMLELLEEAEVPALIIATKADKLKQSERKPAIKRIREGLGLDDDHARELGISIYKVALTWPLEPAGALAFGLAEGPREPG